MHIILDELVEYGHIAAVIASAQLKSLSNMTIVWNDRVASLVPSNPSLPLTYRVIVFYPK